MSADPRAAAPASRMAAKFVTDASYSLALVDAAGAVVEYFGAFCPAADTPGGPESERKARVDLVVQAFNAYADVCVIAEWAAQHPAAVPAHVAQALQRLDLVDEGPL